MNPYENLDGRAFWALAVGQREPLDIEDLWAPKFPVLPRHKIATFGSCFAQHIGRALAARDYGWQDYEPAPSGTSAAAAKDFNYGVFSARTGNIYTTKMLLQWMMWSLGLASAPDEAWEKDGRFYDPFRPAIESNGFASKAEMLASRELALAAFSKAVRQSNIFVFTLGLTEAWVSTQEDVEYAICPGTVAGNYDPDLHKFYNHTAGSVRKNLIEAIRLARSVNAGLKFILTVSPVPLTATMSGKHVLVATVASKSILRCAAQEVTANRPWVDYFPSYEIISSPPFGGMFFAANKRTVLPEGVDHVMKTFFACQTKAFGVAAMRMEAKAANKEVRIRQRAVASDAPDDVVCEEALLAAFSKLE